MVARIRPVGTKRSQRVSGWQVRKGNDPPTEANTFSHLYPCALSGPDQTALVLFPSG